LRNGKTTRDHTTNHQTPGFQRVDSTIRWLQIRIDFATANGAFSRNRDDLATAKLSPVIFRKVTACKDPNDLVLSPGTQISLDQVAAS
jgi:hypothetical protein